MVDESVGYYWNQAAQEREAMERHDREHPGDPHQYYGECDICAERVEVEDVEIAVAHHKEEMAIDRAIESDKESCIEDQRYETWKKQKDYEEAINEH